MYDLMTVDNLKKHYQVGNLLSGQHTIKALDGISFSLKKGETLAIVGESGCGKSTLAKTLIGLEKKDSGNILIDGTRIESVSKKQLIRNIQMIFQDPYGSLNPRKKAWQIISEPLFATTKLPKKQCKDISINLMKKVGLREDLSDRYPHQFSGGQRQRIGIARSLVLKPQILICDEPVSALDVSIQAQVINLLMDLQDELGLSYILIAHDLSVIKHIADKVIVMYLGKMMESGTNEMIFNNSKHPYTRALLNSTPKISEDFSFTPIEGDLPSSFNPPVGCPFHTRCMHKTNECLNSNNLLRESEGRLISCIKNL